MRRWIGFLSFLVTLATAAVVLAGCSRQSGPEIIVIQQPAAPTAQQPVGTVAAAQPAAPSLQSQEDTRRPDAPRVLDLELPPLEPSRQEKYETALLDALRLVTDRKYPAALTALENVRAIQDTEQVRQEIEGVKRRIDEQVAAERTVADIETVLKDGKPEEAARLALAALQQYGGADCAGQLIRLKLQADALVAAQASGTTDRRTRLKQEGETALRERNLRAALVAFEQALQAGDDADLRRQADEIRGTLARYDENRQRAADLRRDPVNLEEALSLLRQAAAAWDTPQIRQEIEECTLALQSRRDRLSVADFEVRGDVGLAQAGRTIAEELLPAFKRRFDLVERDQLAKVLEELRLESSALTDNHQARQELSRLAKLRYLVVGSVTPLSGITVQARLVDVHTGLVVQTAKLVVARPDELLRSLPRLATVLLMSDEQKLAFEQQLAQQKAAEVPVIALSTPLPPPPPEAARPSTPPVIAYTPRPPAFGGLVIEDFQRLPPPAPPGVALEVGVVREDPIRQRLLRLSVELGDNLFSRGRFAEAHRHFELALSLSAGHKEIALRLERCRPRVPPPPVVVAAPPPGISAPPSRPRLVVFNFLVNCEPGLVPPALGDWASESLAAYFAPQYEIIERGEVCWYMGRLGVTLRDVLLNPSARLGLAQALNVRYFVFGAVRQTASFNVETHLIDAQSGQRQGGGSIHVQDSQELKLRLRELAQQTAASPAEQARLAQQGGDNEKALNEVRSLIQSGNYARAAEVSRTALQRNPDNVALQTLLHQAEQQARQAEVQAARQAELQRRQAEAEAARKRAEDLARQAEAARRKAEQEARARDESARRAQAAQRQQAYERQLAQGQQALQRGNFAQAVTLLESAVALNPTDVARRDLAQAKSKVEEAARARAAQEQARREAELRRQREAELAQVRKRVEEERQRREAEQAARAKAQEAARIEAEKRKQAEEQKKLAKAEEEKRHQQEAARSRAAAPAQPVKPPPTPPSTPPRVESSPKPAPAQPQPQSPSLKPAPAVAGPASPQPKPQPTPSQPPAQPKPLRPQPPAPSPEYTQQMQAAAKYEQQQKYEEARKAYQQALRLVPGDEKATKGVAFGEHMIAGQKAHNAKRFPEAVQEYEAALKVFPGHAQALDALKRARQGKP